MRIKKLKRNKNEDITGNLGVFWILSLKIGYIWKYPDIKKVTTKISKNNRGYNGYFGYNRGRISKKTRFETSFWKFSKDISKVIGGYNEYIGDITGVITKKKL